MPSHTARHPHAKLIEALGGQAAISRDATRYGLDIKPPTISMWKLSYRGIAWHSRLFVVRLAAEKGKSHLIPKGFLGPA